MFKKFSDSKLKYSPVKLLYTIGYRIYPFCQAFLENLFKVLNLFIAMTTETTLNPQIEEGWKKALAEEFGAEF